MDYEEDLPPELWESILSFCDASSLCALNLTSGSLFRDLTDCAFAQLALIYYGMESEPGKGKQTWSKGLALVKPRKHFCVPLAQPAEYVCEPNREDLFYDSIATHPTSSFIVYNMDNFSGGTFEHLSGENPTCYRDAQTLSFVRCQPNPWIVWSVALCGRPGCEIVVTTHWTQVMAQQGGRSQMIDLSSYDREGAMFQERRGYPIDVIGCERCLIAIAGDVIYVFQPTYGFGGTLLAYVTSVSFNGGQVDEEARPALVLACPELPGTFGFVPRSNTVSVWRTHGEVCEPTELKTFPTAVTLGSLAVGVNYVAGSADEHINLDSRRIRIYKRSDGEEIHLLREHVPEDLSGAKYTPGLEFVGNLLVSTSHFGNMLCVWNAKDGTLLRRYDDAILRGISRSVYDLGPYTPVTSMVRLHGTGSMAFLVAVGPNLCLWSFPNDWRGDALTQNLANRELRLARCRNAFGFSQEPIW